MKPKKDPLKVASFFAGIGGFDLGFENAGMQVSFQSEINTYCQRVLRKHWPKTPLVPDINDISATDIPKSDVWCGGFPCQDLSYAGKGEGLSGERSGLYFEVVRLVRELRPRYVLLENVAALLTRGLDVVLGELAACGN